MKALLFAAIVYVNGQPVEIPEGYVLDFKLIPFCEQYPDDPKCNLQQCIIYDNCPTEPPPPPPTCQDDPKYCGAERCEVWPNDAKCRTQQCVFLGLC
jgi:hypothetical protein